MTNRLKSLELVGYKTFATKTKFEFSGDITVIVGPNGSGKSNIADSLRWVLGEQSFRLLRGRRTDDMIFSGSQTRPRSGMASATVTFDNSDGWLPIDFSEVSITRRAYRDGQNEYLINGQRVRLKDVNELLASSGLAERTYTVIGQGLVDAALTLKAEERRRLFEEAAGIGLYRSRKEQALRRLDTTKRNLERVEDILSELSPRLRSLRRQARRAEEYEQVRTDLQEVLREWYGYHWHQAQKEIQQVKKEVEQHEKNLQSVKEVQTSAEQTLAEMRDRINNLRSQLNSWHRQLSQIHSQREETSRDLAVSGERRRALLERETRTQDDINRLEEEISRQQARLEEFQHRVDEARQMADMAQGELDSARQALDQKKQERKSFEDAVQQARSRINQLTATKAELNARREELTNRIVRLDGELKAQDEQFNKAVQEHKTLQDAVGQSESARSQAADQLSQQQAEVDQLRAQINTLNQQRSEVQTESAQMQTDLSRLQAEFKVLEEAEASLSGYASGAKVLLQAAREGKINQTAKALGSQLQVPEKFEVAVAAALGDYVDAILLDSTNDSDQALELLSRDPSRAALLPLADLSPLKALDAQQSAGCLGVASDLVEVSPQLRPAVDLLLGQVLVVEDRKAARQVLRGKDNHIRAVTLKGEVFYGSGAILVDSGKRAATLSRPRQQKSLAERGVQLETRLNAFQRQLESLDAEDRRLQGDLTKLTGLTEQAEQEIRQADTVYRKVSLDFDQAEQHLAWLSRQQENIRTEIAQAQNTLQTLEEQSGELAAASQNAEIALEKETNRLEQHSLEDLVSQVSYWEAQVSIGQQGLNSATQVYQEQERLWSQQKTRLEEQITRMGEIKAQLVELDYKVEQMRSSEGGIGEEIHKLNQLIEPAEAELEKLESIQENELDEESEARKKTGLAERYYTQAQITLARRQESMDTLRQRIETDFGLVEFEYTSDVPGPSPLPFGDVVQHLPVVESISEDLEEILKQQRLQLRRLGAVNPDAQREYREVNERHDFLTKQVEDLRHAERDIREVIAELDELMERDFRETFEVVAKEFKKVFTRLFAGGAASLVLTEGEDLDTMGIDIEARLPGKRTQELALLSGGERSLTAAALVFALIKASPTPFCVMDEVDAMLDEANVGRFRQVLEELSTDTQFVVITHNRHTVQAADVIYGITMGRDTTSQTISLKLEEVDERYSSN
jgi:chromosome segregation protein